MTVHRTLVAPSLLAADFARLGDEIKRMEEAGADLFHLDVMDGHFVPNISFGIPVVEAIRRSTRLKLDTHLMISEPDKYLQAFAAAGADSLTVHAEVCPHPERTIDAVHSLDLECGLAVNPSTPVEALFPHLRDLDLALVMSVEPGFGGQSFIPQVVPKIVALQARIERLVYLEEAIAKDELPTTTKRETLRIEHEVVRLNKFFGGIKEMVRLPAAIFVVDVIKEKIAVAEANRLGIPVVAIVDTNCDPSVVQYPIPGNDDGVRAIRLITSEIATAIATGRDAAVKLAQERMAEEAELEAQEEAARAQAQAEAAARVAAAAQAEAPTAEAAPEETAQAVTAQPEAPPAEAAPEETAEATTAQPTTAQAEPAEAEENDAVSAESTETPTQEPAPQEEATEKTDSQQE